MKQYGMLLLVILIMAVITGLWFAGARLETPEDISEQIGEVDITETEIALADPPKLKVSVSLPLLKYLVERIGGERVEVQSLIQGASCSHEYEPTTGDMKAVANSDLFIKVGLDFDNWVDSLTASALNNSQPVFDVSRGVTPIIDEAEAHDDHVDLEQHEHHEDHEHGAGNPHYWGNPDNVLLMAANIKAALTQVAPEQQQFFEAGYSEFKGELQQLTASLQQQVKKLPNRKIASYSAAFPYFYQYFGFENKITVESTCEQEVSPKRLTEVAELIKTEQLQVLVGEVVYPKLPDNLVEATNIQKVLLWPAVNESGDYLATIKENVQILVTALTPTTAK